MAAILTSNDALAQASSQTYIFEGTSFWVALFSGLLLALAFQVVLTGLSFAMGMSLSVKGTAVAAPSFWRFQKALIFARSRFWSTRATRQNRPY